MRSSHPKITPRARHACTIPGGLTTSSFTGCFSGRPRIAPTRKKERLRHDRGNDVSAVHASSEVCTASRHLHACPESRIGGGFLPGRSRWNLPWDWPRKEQARQPHGSFLSHVAGVGGRFLSSYLSLGVGTEIARRSSKGPVSVLSGGYDTDVQCPHAWVFGKRKVGSKKRRGRCTGVHRGTPMAWDGKPPPPSKDACACPTLAEERALDELLDP